MVSAELLPVLQTLSKDAKSLAASLSSSLPAESDGVETSKGPSLLTLKNSTLLFYIHHLVLLTSHRLRGRSLDDGTEGALLVRNLIKLRLIMEKIKPVESKMRSLIERLLRAADEDEKRRSEWRVEAEEGGTAPAEGNIDPLSFRPNLDALTLRGMSSLSSSKPSAEEDAAADPEALASRDRGDGIYRPPRVAPVVYDGSAVGQDKRKSKEDKKSVSRNSALLSEVNASLSSNPYEASSSGIGVNGSGQGSSSRAKALARMQQYEEDNFTRLTMSKKDAKRRRRDEADVALGGAGLSSKRGRVGAGLEEEFGDLLRNKASFDKVKRQGAVQRARESRTEGSAGSVGWNDLLEGNGSGKRTTFQKGLRKEKSRSKGRR